ncbi:Nitrilotriacetate monooxygenase component A [Streptomyces netropsis]|nr:Nitrilotriacetate monooxygenase component A [Streptomyces netropsis]
MTTRTGQRQLRLAALFPGVGTTTARSAARSGSRLDFASVEHLARTAERGLFDFLFLDGGFLAERFLAEGPRPREHQGQAHDLDVAGRPEPLTVLSALAAVTGRLGLAATVDATFGEPYELARRLASLDHLSGGRAAWHPVACSDARTGENFRHGGRLDRAGRHTRAAESVTTARELWDSWAPDGTPRPFAHHGRHFDIAGEFDVARSPQGHPVVIQADDSEEGRALAAATADVVLTRHGSPEAGRAFSADVKGRLATHGRRPEDLKIMPVVTFVLGDTTAENGEGAKGLSIRQSVTGTTGRPSFAGTPSEVADGLTRYAEQSAADGFVLVPHLAPGGLDDFVDRVVPLLQERGAFRTEYTGSTLREHLGLPLPAVKIA